MGSPPIRQCQQSIERPRAKQASLTRALLPGAQQLVAQLLLVLGARPEAFDVGQRVERLEPEELLEEWRRAIEDRAELRAPALLDQAAVLEGRDRRVGVDAAD